MLPCALPKRRGLLGGTWLGFRVSPAGTTTSLEPLITAAMNHALELVLKPQPCHRSGKALPGTPALEHRARSPRGRLARSKPSSRSPNPLPGGKHSAARQQEGAGSTQHHTLLVKAAFSITGPLSLQFPLVESEHPPAQLCQPSLLWSTLEPLSVQHLKLAARGCDLHTFL